EQGLSAACLEHARHCAAQTWSIHSSWPPMVSDWIGPARLMAPLSPSGAASLATTTLTSSMVVGELCRRPTRRSPPLTARLSVPPISRYLSCTLVGSNGRSLKSKDTLMLLVRRLWPLPPGTRRESI